MPSATSVPARSAAGPTTVSERLPLLDAIRGMALGGILLANLTSFFGADMLDAAGRAAQPAAAVGQAVLFGVDWLVEGKFYSVFSMLFGIGFALQAARAGARGHDIGPFFRRRMAVLVLIGLTHMYALWAGDILLLYGVMGLLLPWLWRWPLPSRLAAMAGLFTLPFATHLMVWLSDGALDPRAPFAAVGARLREAFGIASRSTLELFARGSSLDYWAWNTAYAVVRPGTYLQAGRPAKVLALFLLGAWLATTVLPRLAGSRRLLWRTAWLGGTLGLLASGVYAAIKAEARSTFELSGVGLVQTAAYTLGTTPLALAYMAVAALAWQQAAWQARLAWFVPLGRMALSVYLTQTLLQLLLFSSHGARLAGRLPIALLPAVALAILVTQQGVCRWWLARHAQGPVEWVWRRATYGR
ncbi:MAG: DUF418 domain-containing protein [Acidobacteria bacterium]|nr:DUF418 domain-containing protein [Acidobacteriota bacterium]